MKDYVKQKQLQKEKYWADPEAGRAKNRASYRRTSEKRRAYQVEFRKNHPEKKKAWDARYYQEHKEEIRARVRQWSKANIEKLGTQRRARWRSDINYRFKVSLRKTIYRAIANAGTRKSKKTVELIGCTVDFLRKHLEQQFKNGMSWGNYGDWHVDHIVPISRFNLSVPFQQLQCFHYSNLRPLWASENKSKGAKILQTHQSELPMPQCAVY